MANYQRLFYIFNKLDYIFGQSSSPSGYFKIEINDNRIKAQVILQNMPEDKKYSLYGMECSSLNLDYLKLCDIPIEKGKADYRFELDGNGANISKMNVFAVITAGNDYVKCPLVAYSNGEVEWRGRLEAVLAGKSKSAYNKPESAHEYKSEAMPKSSEAILKPVPQIEPEYKTEALVQQEPDSASENAAAQPIPDPATNNDGASGLEPTYCESQPEAALLEIAHPESTHPETTQPETASPQHQQQSSKAQQETEEPENEISQELMKAAEGITDIAENLIESKYHSELTDIYEKKDKSPNDLWVTLQKKIVEQEKTFEELSVDEAQLEIANKNLENKKHSGNFKVASLVESLDGAFEVYNPFKTKSRNIKWWKINSPGYLNNILFKNNIKTYILFNSKVLMAHFKYRHIILGLQIDKASGREQLLCGVPGIYNIDENPFGSISSWVQMEGYKPRYGAFGYWMVSIDPRSGKISKIK